MKQSEVFKLISDEEMVSIIDRAIRLGHDINGYAWYYVGEDNARAIIEGAIWKAAALVAGKMEEKGQVHERGRNYRNDVRGRSTEGGSARDR